MTLILLLGAFGPISTDMFLPAMPQVVAELGTDPSTFNVSMYGFMLGMACSSLAFGPTIDRYGRKRPLAVFLVEYIVTTIACGLVNDVYSFIILRILQAIGSGAAITISVALVKDLFDGPERIRVLNVNAVIGVLGPILSPIIGSAIISVWGWRATFFAPAAIAALALVMGMLMTETIPEGERSSGGMSQVLGGLKSLVRDRGFLIMTVTLALFNLPFMGYLSVSSYIYEDMFGVSQGMYSILLGATLVVGTVAMLVINRLTKGMVNSRKILIFPAIGAVSAVLMFAVGQTSWQAFMVAFSICMMAAMTVRPWGMGMLMASHEGDNGAISGIINFMFFLIGCVGMVISTLPWPNFAFAIGVLISLATVLFAVFLAVFKAMGMDLKGLHIKS
ncbi:MAG: MFS transporter [Candidatus Methanomethylophilaceae archaeon]|nr:MFS transporter [Candidatus Methanomethylophilaceae archaeon]